jgi:hypothetical protein
MKHAALVLLLAAACERQHAAGSVEVRGGDCVTCHLSAYQTANPPHPGNFPQTCGDCHTTAGWIPALQGGHPEDRFPIAQGAHQGIACGNCHDSSKGTSVGGANTNCIACHTQTESDPRHSGVSDYSFNGAMPHFCLSCHPSGQAESHPEAAFPIASGAHQPFACNDCHIASMGPNAGGANTSCIGCHTGAHTQSLMDPRHREASRYNWDATMPHFCLTCHPTGIRGGD